MAKDINKNSNSLSQSFHHMTCITYLGTPIQFFFKYQNNTLTQ